ncbi:MAG: roadblock/LC7 domain-containing protein, partial [Anaerolineales bacterium]
MDTHGANALEMEAAERIVGFLAYQEGVAGVTVSTPDGALLASKGTAEAGAEALLAAFICERAAEVTSEDDLRGMGKLVSESEFHQLAVSGPKGEALVYPLDRGCLLVSARLGQLVTAAQSAVPVISRFGPAASGRR